MPLYTNPAKSLGAKGLVFMKSYTGSIALGLTLLAFGLSGCGSLVDPFAYADLMLNADKYYYQDLECRPTYGSQYMGFYDVIPAERLSTGKHLFTVCCFLKYYKGLPRKDYYLVAEFTTPNPAERKLHLAYVVPKGKELFYLYSPEFVFPAKPGTYKINILLYEDAAHSVLVDSANIVEDVIAEHADPPFYTIRDSETPPAVRK